MPAPYVADVVKKTLVGPISVAIQKLWSEWMHQLDSYMSFLAHFIIMTGQLTPP